MEQVTWELKSAAEAWFIYGSHCLSMEFLLAYVWFLLIEEAGQIWACANSLDHLDCSHGAMAVFYFRKEFLSPSMKVVWTCTCANSFDHLDFIFGSRSQNQDEFSVNFVLRWKFIFFFLPRKLFEFRACTNSLDHLDCSCHSCALTVFYFGKKNSHWE